MKDAGKKDYAGKKQYAIKKETKIVHSCPKVIVRKKHEQTRKGQIDRAIKMQQQVLRQPLPLQKRRNCRDGFWYIPIWIDFRCRKRSRSG